MNDVANADIDFLTGTAVSTAQMTLASTGFLGLNRTAPVYALDLGIILADTWRSRLTAQRTGANGVFRYNTALSNYEGYSGSAWKQMSFPTGITNYTLRYDGSNWVTSPNFTNTNTVVALNASGAALNITNSAAETTTTTPFYVLGNSTGTLRMRIKNSNAGAAADTRLVLENDIGRIAGFYIGSNAQGKFFYLFQ